MSRPRILMLTHRVPYPPNRGDRIRAWQMLQFLAQDYDIYLGTTADEPVTSETKAMLTRHCAAFEIAPLGKITRWRRGIWDACRGNSLSQGMFAHPGLQARVNRWQREQAFDAAVVYYSSMFPYVDQPLWRDVPKLVDLIDVDSQKWSDYAQASQGWRKHVYQREANKVSQLERRIVTVADIVTVTTEVEAQILKQVAPRALPCVVANGVNLPVDLAPADMSISGRLVFVGVLDYRPNVEGIVWFVEHVWPRIKSQHPAATLQIVGRQPVKAVTDLAHHPGVEIVANTPDVRPHLQAAQIVIAPLHIARGVQNKVLEAFAECRAVVATPAACQGLDVTPDEELLVAENVTAWQSSLNSLLQSATRREQIALTGYEYVNQHHRWANCLAPLAGWLESVCGKASPSFALPEPLLRSA